jgi:hypothetical protein
LADYFTFSSKKSHTVFLGGKKKKKMEKVGELWQNVVNTDKFCLLDPDLHFECGSRSRQWFECGSGSETLVFKFTSITR